MASPSQAEVETQLKNAVDILEEGRKYAKDNAKNFIDQQDTYVQSLESDFAGPAITALDQTRTALATFLSNAGIILGPVIQAEGKRIAAPETDVLSILARMYDDFIDNSRTVKSRGFVFGSPAAAGGNIGDGVLLRLNTDANAFNIENQTPDGSKNAFCVLDQNSGRPRNQEQFNLRGGFSGVDILDVEGVGSTALVDVKAPADSPTDNMGFDSFEGATALTPTGIPSWTSSVTVDSTNYEFDDTNRFLPAADTATTVHSLNIKALAAKLTQNIVDEGVSLDVAVPHYFRVYYNREVGSADGTLTIRMGSNSASVVLAAQTGWNALSLTLDENLWFKNFNQDPLTIEIERTGGTTGELLIDDATFVPFSFFDGGWYLPLPGATPFLREDEFDWSDTIASDSKIQRWLWRAFGLYLPHSGTPTITDP